MQINLVENVAKHFANLLSSADFFLIRSEHRPFAAKPYLVDLPRFPIESACLSIDHRVVDLKKRKYKIKKTLLNMKNLDVYLPSLFDSN